jgi:hypothetical protein
MLDVGSKLLVMLGSESRSADRKTSPVEAVTAEAWGLRSAVLDPISEGRPPLWAISSAKTSKSSMRRRPSASESNCPFPMLPSGPIWEMGRGHGAARYVFSVPLPGSREFLSAGPVSIPRTPSSASLTPQARYRRPPASPLPGDAHARAPKELRGSTGRRSPPPPG